MQDKSRLKIKDLEFGGLEAESECHPKSKIQIADAFDDFNGVVDRLEHDKHFLIIGRKGTGKSAIARIYSQIEKYQNTTSATYLNSVSLSLEKLIQTNQATGINSDAVSLFKWAILVSVAKQLSSLEMVKQLPQFSSLEDFFVTNSGYVELGKGNLVETFQKHKGNISVKGIYSFFNFHIQKLHDKELKEIKASYFTVIPYLQEIVLFLLNSEFTRGWKFRVVFDDVDVIFKKDSNSLNELAELLRVVKDFNIDIFGPLNVDTKIIVCIRSDQLSLLKSYPDMNKLVDSYGAKISWYDHALFVDDFELLPLKRFMDSRIELAFRGKVKNNPKSSINHLFLGDQREIFKKIIDYTFYRPRDIIMYLNIVRDTYPNNSPPTSFEYTSKMILSKFSAALARELRSELGMLYEEEKIDKIFNVLRSLSDEFSSTNFLDTAKKQGLFDSSLILDDLFKYGVIGKRDAKGDVAFAYWGKDTVAEKYIKHYGLRPFLSANHYVEGF